MIHPQPKPSKRSTEKRKAKVIEALRVRDVRGDCVERDGFCRMFSYAEDVYQAVGACEGVSEWMHLWDKKRARTRGMPPEIRHTTADSMMGCTRHHAAYDAGLLSIEPLTDKGADGQLRVGEGDCFAIV